MIMMMMIFILARASRNANRSFSVSSSIGKALGRSSDANSSFSTSSSNGKAIGQYQRINYVYFVELLEKKIKVAESKDIKNMISAGRIHASLLKLGFKSDQLCGKLIRLYGSLGYTADAQRFFYECHFSNVAGIGVWNAIIATLGRGGKGDEALKMFFSIPKELVKTESTYWNAMVACSHAGKPEWAHYILGKIFKRLSMEPAIEHVGTYIDALARNGQLDDAANVVKSLVYTPNREIIVSILDRCQPQVMDNRDLAIKFVKYLEQRGISYRVVKTLYERLAEAGVVWSSNVKILRQRIKGASSGRV